MTYLRIVLVLELLVACGPTSGGGGNGTPDSGGAPVDGGRPDACADCACDPGQSTYCVGDEVYECTAEGQQGDHVATCALESCHGGACNDACGEAAVQNSYLGCEYWPIDLDNGLDLFGQPIPEAGDCALYASTLTTVTWTIDEFSVCVPGSGQAGTGGLCDYGGDCSLAGGGTCQPMTLCAIDAGRSPFGIVVSNPDANDPVDVTLRGPAGESYTT